MLADELGRLSRKFSGFWGPFLRGPLFGEYAKLPCLDPRLFRTVPSSAAHCSAGGLPVSVRSFSLTALAAVSLPVARLVYRRLARRAPPLYA